MIIIELKNPSQWTLVVDKKGWYIRVQGILDDNRHNNEFLVFKGESIDLYIANLKFSWNECVKKVLAAVDLYGDMIMKNCDEIRYNLGSLIECDSECIDFKNGLMGFISIGNIGVSDLEMMRGFTTKDDGCYTDRYYFLGVIDLHFNQFKNARISFQSRTEVDFFIDAMRRCEKMAKEINENIMQSLSDLEGIYENKDFEFNLNFKTYFHEYKLESNIVPLKPTIGKPSIIEEHGRSRFNGWFKSGLSG